jgi:glycerol-3-phosphate dehydrogenase (NAD(P)+)
MPQRFTILGDGSWGTAVALLLARRSEHAVTLWSARAENGRLVREQRENVRFLPGVPIPPALRLTSDAAEAVGDADLLIAAIPTLYLRATLGRLAGRCAALPVLSLVKGLETATFRRPTEIIGEVLGPRPLAALSGPSHAEEVSRGLPTSVVAASEDADLARAVQQAFNGPSFRVYQNRDLLGVELAGALKNVIGIAAGISDGLGFGDNAKAALMTRAVVELSRFGVALGAEPQTFMGLAGIGDLITTCQSRHGRNRLVGERLGRGEKLETIIAGMSMVAEGVSTARSVCEKARQMGLDLPISTEVYRVLYEDMDPRTAVTNLMLREPKPE